MSNIVRIEISPSVIEDIVLESIKEVDGVVSIADRIGKSEPINIIKNITGIGNTKHIDVELGETECVIDLGLVVNYGIKISETILKFQEIAKKNIEDLTGIKVNEINVRVSNVIKKSEEVGEN